MRTLLLKELRTLLPFVWLIIGLVVLTTGFDLGTKFPDTNLLVPVGWLNNERTGAFALLVLFGLVIGAGLLVNESEQGTLTFLEGLPISRWQMFVAKVLAALIVLALLPLLGLGANLWMDWLSRDSTDGAIPWRFLVVEFALEMAVVLYVLSIALAFSFFRRWFALFVGLIFWGYLWLKESGPAWITLLDPYVALEPLFPGKTVRVQWSHVGTQFAVSAVLLLVAWYGFRALGDRIQHAIDRFQRHRILQGIATGIRFLAPVVWFAAIAKLATESASTSKASAKGTTEESVFGSRETARYEFLFRKRQEEKATPMIETADEVYAPIADFFGAQPTISRIVVDLASPIVSHAAAQTNWTKIRLPFDDSIDYGHFQRLLGHETTHVFVEQLSDLRMTSLFPYCRFLHEGVATYVELEYFGTEEQQEKNRRAVAAVWSRGAIPFSLLCDDNELGISRDRFLVYPIGQVFVSALVETHGKESVARLIRALARPNAPMGLRGVSLWRDTMQAAEINFDRVEAVYESRCNELLASQKEYVDRFPRITAEVSRQNDEIVIKPQFEGAAPCRMGCVVFVNDFLGNTMRPLEAGNDGSFRIPKSKHPSDRVRYMLGWLDDANEVSVFEPKAEVVLP